MTHDFGLIPNFGAVSDTNLETRNISRHQFYTGRVPRVHSYRFSLFDIFVRQIRSTEPIRIVEMNISVGCVLFPPFPLRYNQTHMFSHHTRSITPPLISGFYSAVFSTTQDWNMCLKHNRVFFYAYRLSKSRERVVNRGRKTPGRVSTKCRFALLSCCCLVLSNVQSHRE